MAFDAIVEITGACAYVPLEDGQIMAVLPDAREPNFDEQLNGMKRHDAFVAWDAIPTTHHGQHHHDNYRNILYLVRQRVTFKACTGNAKPEGKFPNLPDFGAGLNDQRFRKVKRELIEAKPAKNVLAQIVIGCGQIEGTNPAHEEGEWKYRWKWDNQADDEAELYAAGMLVRLGSVESLELEVRGFENKGESVLKLKPEAGANELKIMIANFPSTSTGSSRTRDEHIWWLGRFCKRTVPEYRNIPALVCTNCAGPKVPSRTCFGLQFELE